MGFFKIPFIRFFGLHAKSVSYKVLIFTKSLNFCIEELVLYFVTQETYFDLTTGVFWHSLINILR